MQTTPTTLFGVVGGGEQTNAQARVKGPPQEFEETFEQVNRTSEQEFARIGKEADLDGPKTQAIMLDLIRSILTQPAAADTAIPTLTLALGREQTGIQLQNLSQEALSNIPGGLETIFGALKNLEQGKIPQQLVSGMKDLISQALSRVPASAKDRGVSLAGLGKQLAELIKQSNVQTTPGTAPSLPDQHWSGKPIELVDEDGQSYTVFQRKLPDSINFIHDHQDPFGLVGLSGDLPAFSGDPFQVGPAVLPTTTPAIGQAPPSPTGIGTKFDPRESFQNQPVPKLPPPALAPMTNRLGVSQDQTPDAKGVEPLHGIAQPAPSWGSSVTATKLPEDLSEAISWAQAKIISESSQESQVAQAPVKPEDLEALVLSVAKSPIGKNLSGVAPETTSPKLTETDSSGQDTSTQQISNGKTDELPAKGRHQTQGDEVKIQTQSPEKVKIPVQKLATAFAAEELQGTLLDDREPAIENEVKTTYAEGARTAHASPEKVANMIGEKSEITIDSRVSAPGFVKTIGDQMADRIAELAAHQKPGRIVIRLTPEDLGSITLAVKSSGTKLDVEIQASHESVRHALVNHKQDLLQVVEGKGLSMSSFDVRQDSQGQPGQSQHQDQSMRETFEQAIRLNQTESPRATSPLTINEISSHHKGWEVRA